MKILIAMDDVGKLNMNLVEEYLQAIQEVLEKEFKNKVERGLV